jgi:hypothetical protein
VNIINHDLIAKYDDLAERFFKKESALLNNKNSEKIEIFDAGSINKMKENIFLSGNKRVPGKCDILTAYFDIDDEAVNEVVYDIRSDLKKILPADFDLYFSPVNTLHISLVMIHDLRPSDMENKELLLLRKNEKEISEIHDILDKIIYEPFYINLYGFRFGYDGAGILTFIDNGDVSRLRILIGKSIEKYMTGQLIKYDKPFIHTTIFRIFEDVGMDIYKELVNIQKKYLELLEKNIKLKIIKFNLSREIGWQHSKVEKIGEYYLVKQK